jgi:uncharacterized protein
MFETAVIVFGFILVLSGLAGNLLPFLPGVPLSFAGLFLIALAKHFSPPLTPTLLIIMAILTALSMALDYMIPLLGAKRYGTSKWGIWGSVVGMIIGMFWPPVGMLLGAFVGAVAAEWFVHRAAGRALKAGWGVIVGTLLGTVLKFGVSGVMVYYSARAVW